VLDSSRSASTRIFRPKGTPPEIVDVLTKRRRGAEDPKLVARLADVGESRAMTPAEIGKLVAERRPRNGARWSNSPGCLWIEAEPLAVFTREKRVIQYSRASQETARLRVLDARQRPVIGLAEGETVAGHDESNGGSACFSR